MSFIQKIRDKYARIAVIAIALALLGFILTDYLSTRGGSVLGGNSSTTLGTVNGKKIDYNEFEKKVKATEDRQQASSPMGQPNRQQIIQNAWNQEVTEIIMNAEFGKLGFRVGKKEISDYLFGANPPDDLKQQFTDPQTGQYNAAQAQQAINQMKKGPQDQRAQLSEYINLLEFGRKTEKYNSLFSNSVYYPKWFIEKQNTENSGLAKISYVHYPYTKIADSTVKISDKEIEEYISKHKDQYKQQESRSIMYLVFDAAPTAADSAEIRNQLESLRAEFAASTEPAAFLARYSSNPNFFENYITDSNLKVPNADSIKKLDTGALFGPYLDGGTYTLAKMIDKKTMPDTVKVRHILIKIADRQAGQLRDDSTAKKLADSIKTAVAGGADFNQLVLQYSDDQGSKDKKGEYTFGSTTNLVKNFYETAFFKPVGTKEVVKGESGDYIGYHYMEVLEQKKFEPAYKVAYLTKTIIASSATEDSASNGANTFAGNSRDLKSFNANADSLKKFNVNKIFATDIAPDAYYLQGIAGEARQLIRAIYEAKKGEVLSPILVGDKYIVAAVTETFEEGTMTAASARSNTEPILRNKKKAQEIKKKIPQVTTLEDASAKLGAPIETVDSVRFSGNSKLGYEYKIIGAAFNPANIGKVVTEPIEGTSGVYVLRVDNVTATPVETANIEEQRKALQAQARQAAMYSQPSQTLRLAAKIKDRRSKFY
jgi:peptidyl-prolyl cis-trans isomerase D